MGVLPSMGRFASDVQRKLRSMGNFTVNVGLNIDARSAEARIKDATRDQSVNVGVNVDGKQADAEFAKVGAKADQLDGRDVGLNVTANVVKAITGIAAVATAANELDERTFSPKIKLETRGILSSIARVTARLLALTATSAKVSLGFAGMAVAGAAVVKTVGSLGPMINGIVGAVALLPAMGAMGIAAMGTIMIGAQGVGEALKNAFDPKNAEKFNEAMAKLSPNAQAFVRAIQGMRDQFKALKMDVQERLFAGFAEQVSLLGRNYLPIAQRGFAAMATELNATGVSFMQFLNQGDQIPKMSAMTDNVTLGFHNLMSMGVTPTLRALTTLAEVGSTKLPGIGYAIGSVLGQFDAFIARVAASGELEQFFEQATTQLGLFFQLLGWVGSIFNSIFQAGARAGGNLLGTLVEITGAIATFLRSAQGMAVLEQWFRASNTAMALAKPLLVAIGGLLLAIGPTLATVLPQLGAALGSLAPAMDPLAAILNALMPLLAVVAQIVAQVLVVALNQLAPILVNLAPLFIAWAMSIGGGLIAALTTLGPLLQSITAFLGAHPGLVMAVVTALGLLLGAWRIFTALVGYLMGPLLILRLTMSALGISIAQLGKYAGEAGKIIWAQFTKLGGFIGKATQGLSVFNLFKQALLGLGRIILTAMGPLGWAITIFTILYANNEQLRVAVGNLINAFMGVFNAVASSLTPVLTVLSSVMGGVSGTMGGVANTLGGLLVPVFNALASVITFLQPVLVPLIDAFIAYKVAMMGVALWQATTALQASVMSAALSALIVVEKIHTGVQQQGLIGYAMQQLAMGKAAVAAKLLAVQQWFLNSALLANPITWVVVAIIALVAAVIYAYNHFGWFRDLVDTVWSAIKTGAEAVWGAIVTAFNAIWDFLSQWGTAILAVFLPFIGIPLLIIQNWDSIVAFFSSVFSAIGNFFVNLPTMASNALTAVGQFFADLPRNIALGLGYAAGRVVRFFMVDLPAWVAGAWAYISTAAVNMWNGLWESLSSAAVSIGDWFVALPGRVWGWITSTAAAIGSAAVNLWNSLTTSLEIQLVLLAFWFYTLPSRVWAWLQSVGAAVSSAAASVWSYLTEGLPAQLAALGQWFIGLPGQIVAWLSGAGTWLVSAGGDLIAGLWNGIVSAWNGFWGWIGGLIDSFIIGFKAGLGIASPSTIFLQIGIDILMGLINGLVMMWGMIVSWFTTATTWLANVFTGAWQWIQNAATLAWFYIYTFFVTNLTLFVAFWTGIWNGIVAFFTGIWQWIQNVATLAWFNIYVFFMTNLLMFVAFWTGVWNNIVSFFTGIWQWIQNVATLAWFNIYVFFMTNLAMFTAFWSGVWQNIVNFFVGIWNWIRDTAVNVWNMIYAFLSNQLNMFIGFWSGVWNNIWNFFVGVWNWIRDTAVNAWNNIYNFFAGAFAQWTSFFQGVWDNVKGIFVNVWNSISQEAQRIWDGIVNIVKGAVNGVIDAANWMSGKINIVLRFLAIPEIPMIPRLESGGIIGMARGGRIGREPRTTFAARGTKIGAGFVTNGPRVIVGEGRQNYPEYVVPTDPHYRGRALQLHASLSADLGVGSGNGSTGMPSSGTAGGGGLPQLAEGGILGDIAAGADDLMQWLTGGLDTIKRTIGDGMNALIPDGLFKNAGTGLAGKIVDAVKRKIDAAMEAMANMAGGGAARWAPVVAQALAITGESMANMWRVIAQIDIESSGNPRAINLWDVNAQRGTPSKGLIQTIDPTFQRWRDPRLPNDPYNPLSNIVAGIRYTRARYGSIANIWPKRGGYDSGGIAGGQGIMLKQTLSPERVLSPRQTRAFEQLVPMLDSLARRGPGATYSPNDFQAAGFGGGPAIGAVYQQLPDGASARRFAEELTFEFRRGAFGQGVHG